jgi:hypothetical protein
VEGRSCKCDETAHLETPLLAPKECLYLRQHVCTLYELLIIIWGNHLIGTVILNVEHKEQSIKRYQCLIVLFVRIKSGKVDKNSVSLFIIKFLMSVLQK